jgi:hypothetical protein
MTLNPEEEARRIVSELREEVSHGVAMARAVASLTPDERALLRKVARLANQERRASPWRPRESAWNAPG